MKLELGVRAKQQLGQIRSRLGGAYLFIGPAGVGKFSSARQLADQVISDPRNLLIMETDKPSLGIDLIHDFNYQLQLKATRGHRLAIIRDAEKLTTEAQNAFLKTLEEPPLDTTIILLTSDRTKLLPTIISRCQSVRFDRLSIEDITRHLIQNQGLSQLPATQLAELADGALGKAVTLAENDEAKQKLLATERVAAVLTDHRLDIYQKLEVTGSSDIEPKVLIERLIVRLRQQILDASGDVKILARLQAKLAYAEASWRYLDANVGPKVVMTQLSLEMAK